MKEIILLLLSVANISIISFMVYYKKYGMSRAEYMRPKRKSAWDKKNSSEKREWLQNSIHSEKARLSLFCPKKGYNSSKMELKIVEALDFLNINYLRQFKIVSKEADEDWKYRFYDFYLPETNLIIEFYGDYWHANPVIYDAGKTIHYKFGTITANDIWEKDKKRIDIAKKRGYYVIVIWEQEILKKNKEEICLIVRQKIKEYDSEK